MKESHHAGGRSMVKADGGSLTVVVMFDTVVVVQPSDGTARILSGKKISWCFQLDLDGGACRSFVTDEGEEDDRR